MRRIELLVTCTLLAGCAAREAPEEQIAEDALLAGAAFNPASGSYAAGEVPCPPFRVAEIARTQELVGYLLSSSAFEGCVDAKMRAQYMDCGDDYTATSITSAVNGVLTALENANHLRVVCHSDGDGWWVSSLGTYGTGGTQTIHFGLNHGGGESDPKWDSGSTPGWPWSSFSNSLIHEFLHRQGYTHADYPTNLDCAVAHGWDSADYYRRHEPSVPYIVGTCASQVLSLSRWISPVEGGYGCPDDELSLVSSWTEGDGPGTTPGYTICSPSGPACANGAPCGSLIPGTPAADVNQYGICGGCKVDADCAGMGSGWACAADFCRQTGVSYGKSCVPNRKREVTLYALATGKNVERTAAGYTTAGAAAFEPQKTSFWMVKPALGDLRNYDTVRIKTGGDSWLGYDGSGYIRESATGVPFTVRTTVSDGRVDPGDVFWLQSGSNVVEVASGTTPYLRLTATVGSGRRYFLYKNPTRKLVYLAGASGARWIRSFSTGLVADYATDLAPGTWGAFWQVDQDGGKLESGDRVSFMDMNTQRYWSTATNGDLRIKADATTFGGEDESFVVTCVSCADASDIRHGDTVAYLSIARNKYVTSTGSSTAYHVRADGPSIGTAQRTLLVEVGQYEAGSPLTAVNRPAWIMD